MISIEMMRVFWALCPEHVPHSVILPATPSSFAQMLDEFACPFVAKEVRNYMGRGVHLIESRSDFAVYCQNNDILCVQECLPIERDLRAVYVGERIVGAHIWEYLQKYRPQPTLPPNLKISA